ncbi:MAG: prefoldin subunit alpha [Candidatus Thorarchaeota archaeon]
MAATQDYQEQLQIFRYLKEQRDMYQGQLEIINASLANILNTKMTIQNIKEGVKVDDEILVPIGGLAHIKVSMKDSEKVLVAVTQDVIIEKDLDGAIELLDMRVEQHNKEIEFIKNQIQNIDLNLQKTSQLIQREYLQQ